MQDNVRHHHRSSPRCPATPTSTVVAMATVATLLMVAWHAAPVGHTDVPMISLMMADRISPSLVDCSTKTTKGLPQPAASSQAPSDAVPIPALGGVCTPLFPAHRVAYVVVYDLSEETDQLPLRNAQFSRVFKGLRDARCEVSELRLELFASLFIIHPTSHIHLLYILHFTYHALCINLSCIFKLIVHRS